MDVRFINPFVQAIGNVFKTMLKTEVAVQKPFIKQTHGSAADVSGVIGLSGDVTGAVVLTFPMEVACRAASTFAGVEIKADSPDFSDAIGELANMVAGNAKKDFHGFDVSISLPSVIVGKGHVVSASQISPQLVIPCHTAMGNFAVEVSLRVEKSNTISGVRPSVVGAAQ